MKLTVGKKKFKDDFNKGLRATSPIAGTVGAVSGAVGGLGSAIKSKGSTKLKVASTLGGAVAGGIAGKVLGDKFKNAGKKKSKFNNNNLNEFKKTDAIIGTFPKSTDKKKTKKKSVMDEAVEAVKNKDKLITEDKVPENIKTGIGTKFLMKK